MTTEDDLFARAVRAWRCEPFNADAFDEVLIAMVTSDQAAAMGLAREHLNA